MSPTNRLKADLVAAMRGRDEIRVRTIRSLISAIDNAGAVEVDGQGPDYDPRIGMGHDVDRRHLTDDDIARIIVSERDDLAAARDEYRRLGELARAEELERRVQIAERYLG